MIVPNIAAPMKKRATWEAANVRLRNRSSGMIGSGTRRSQRTNETSSTALATNSPTISGDPHGYCAPPQTVASSPALRPALSRAAPV